MNKKILLSFILGLIVNLSFATVSASVDRSGLQLGQTLTLSINMSNTNGDPDLDSLKTNFEVYGTSTRSQMSIVNGQTSSQKTLSVTLMPKHAGKQTIPAIKVGNDITAPIQINVITQSTSDKIDSKSNVFLVASTSESSTYLDVPVLYSVKLYYAVQLSNLSMAPLDIKNAQIKPLGKPSQYQANEHGQTYQVVEQQFIITPSSAGAISIPNAEIRGSQADNSSNANGIFGVMMGRPFSVKSESLSLQVKDIPNSINISDWFPAKNVTATDEWSVNTESLNVGAPITRTITINASGITDSSIPDISFTTPNGVNAYPDKTVASSNTDQGNLSASKVFKIAYIPTNAGNITFPETQVSWWDITAESLKTVTIPAKSYVVIDNPNKPMLQTPGVTTNSKPTSTIKPNNKWYYIAIALGILWLLSMIVMVMLFKKRKRKVTTDKIDNKAIVKAISEKNTLARVYKACKDHDVAALNIALIEWAKCHFKRPIYTVSDISDIAKSSELRILIDKLNLALYRGAEFNSFVEIRPVIEQIIASSQTKQKEPFKPFYPQ